MSDSDIRFTDPFAGIFANTAGVRAVADKKRGFQFNKGGFDFADPIFGEGGAGADLADFVKNPLQIGDLGQTARAFTDAFSGPALFDFAQTAGGISSTIQEGLATGFRTDIAPIAAKARRDFSRQTIPEIAERFAGTSGINSSDFGDNLLAAGGNLEFNLASLQTELDEAAAGRITNFAQFAPNANLVNASGFSALGGEFANLEALFRGQEESVRPGSRALDFLLSAGGRNQGTTASPEGGPGAAAQIIGGIADPSGLLGGGGAAGVFS